MRRNHGGRLPVPAGGHGAREILSGKPRLGELVGACCGLGLLVLSFLPWYSAEGVDATAWEAFSVIDLVIAAAVIAAVVVAVVDFARVSVSYPVAGSAIATGCGAAAFVCILIRLIDPPAEGADPAVAAWLGLFAAGGIVLGGYMGMQEPS